ncbi:hypothetical protein KOR42_09510 [Thalassoglobus neptunius]|uniref:Uncharacterized protein n=1 Tax=Thalassoglobus neptunius TaxID=1938619 RepID=A0A5C5X4T2_9PLAN|nr:hypothetical protein KOR42_09510 [Thalassoglobus neptunius]
MPLILGGQECHLKQKLEIPTLISSNATENWGMPVERQKGSAQSSPCFRFDRVTETLRVVTTCLKKSMAQTLIAVQHAKLLMSPELIILSAKIATARDSGRTILGLADNFEKLNLVNFVRNANDFTSKRFTPR